VIVNSVQQELEYRGCRDNSRQKVYTKYMNKQTVASVSFRLVFWNQDVHIIAL
jgi:hypothetical protein